MRIPPFQNEFLETIADSFRKRSKAISHMVAATVEVDKVYRDVDGDQLETLEFNLQSRAGNPRLKIMVWHDRWVWLDARVGSKNGWVWEWAFEGRLLGNISSKIFVEAVERTIGALSHVKHGQTNQLSDPWEPLLARGPQAVS